MGRSDRHVELQNMLVRWMKNRSFKMLALPECNVGYIADFVAIAGLFSEFHRKYARFAGLEKKYMGSQMTDDGWKWVSRGDLDRWYVCIFEVKVSREDFLNTFGPNKKTPHALARSKPVGTVHWVVAEKGICTPDELPDFWGLLVPYGGGLSEVRMPKAQVLSEDRLHSFAWDMIWTEKNARDSYYEQLYNMSETIGKVYRAILRGKSQKELLQLSEQAVKSCKGFVGA